MQRFCWKIIFDNTLTLSFIPAFTLQFVESIRFQSESYFGCIDAKRKKKKIIFRVMRHLSRIFMKEGATRANFSIPLQLAR